MSLNVGAALFYLLIKKLKIHGLCSIFRILILKYIEEKNDYTRENINLENAHGGEGD